MLRYLLMIKMNTVLKFQLNKTKELILVFEDRKGSYHPC